MHRIERENAAQNGRWRWTCGDLEGISRQPLLDACRHLQRLGAAPSEAVGLFRAGKSGPDLVSSVGVAAALTVEENDRFGPRFAKFKPFVPIVRNPG
jgi:hypothetical protein